MSGPGLDTLEMRGSLESKLFGLTPPALSIGRFRVLERLGHGGMGVVFSVYDETLDRRVALKVLRGDGSESRRQRLRREAKAMARLSHPNVVPVFEVGEHEDQLFIVMEYVAGQTLGAWQRAEPRPLTEVLEKYAQAGRGLAAAHAQGIIHRDFKPDNAIIRASGRVQVLDFGLSRRTDDAPDVLVPHPNVSAPTERSGTPLTETGSIVGTPAYMAPEQFDGGRVDERSDQFAFCISLWEALCGERPFKGDSVPALSTAVASGDVRRPPADARMTSAVQRVLERGLSPNPEERWPSLEAMLHALEPKRGTSTQWMAAGLAAAGLAVGAVALLRTSTDTANALDPCVDGAGKLATAWDPERRAQVERGLQGVDTPIAASVASAVVTKLDAYADAWLEGHDEACQAAMVDRTQSRDVRDQRYRCLDERKRRLGALVQVLQEPTKRIFDNAVTQAAALLSIERCADLDYVALEEPPPEDPDEAAAWAKLLDDLALAQALRIASKFDASLQLARTHLDASKERDWPSGVLRAANEVSATLTDLGRSDEAMDAAAEGFVVAASGTRHEAIRNLLLLGGVYNHTGNYAEALLFRRKALQMRREVYGERDMSVGQIHGFIGDSYLWQNRAAKALEHYQRSYDVLRASLDENTHEMAQVHAQLGGALQRLERFEEAFEHLETSLRIREQVLGRNHPYVANSKIRLGLAHGGREEHEEAVRWYQGALEIYASLDMLGHPEVGTAHLNMGVSYENLKRYDEARSSYVTARDIYTETDGPNHPYTAIANANLGEVSALQGKYDEALEHYAVALRARRTKMGDTAPNVGDTLANMATIAAEGGRHEDALRWASEALEIHLAATGEDHEDVQRDLELLAAAHAALGHDAEANRYRDRALAVEAALQSPAG